MVENNSQNRRDFIKTTALAGIGTSLLTPNMLFGKDDRKVALGFIGAGRQGRSHLRSCLQRNDVEAI